MPKPQSTRIRWALLRAIGPLLLIRLTIKVLAGLASGAQVWFIGLLTDRLMKGLDPALHFILYVLSTVVSGLDGMLSPVFLHMQEHKVTLVLKKAMFSLLSRTYIEDMDTLMTDGDTVTVKKSIEEASGSIEALLNLVERVVYLGAIFTLIAQAGWLWLSVALMSLVPAILASANGAKRVQTVLRSASPELNYANYLLSVFLEKNTSEEIRWLNIGDRLVDLRNKATSNYDHSILRESNNATLKSMAAIVISGIGMASFAVAVITKALDGQTSPGTAVGILAGLVRLMQGGANMARSVMKLAFQVRAANRAWSRLGEIALGNAPVDIAPLQPPKGKVVAVDGLCFKYRDADRLALDNITFEVNPGQVVAVVGRNGSGKSTLLRLLVGVLRPSSGLIYCALDGASVVWQSPSRFAFSIRENIAFGDVEHGLTNDPDIRRAAEAAGLEVESIGGLDQTLGQIRPNGRDLSTGQWQRLALARAFYRGGSVLILDEPTAYMDPESEVAFYKALFRERSQQTVIVASHRLGVARIADMVIVLDQGHLVEMGSHQDLVRSGGLYSRLYRSQAQWYASDEELRE